MNLDGGIGNDRLEVRGSLNIGGTNQYVQNGDAKLTGIGEDYLSLIIQNRCVVATIMTILQRVIPKILFYTVKVTTNYTHIHSYTRVYRWRR